MFYTRAKDTCTVTSKFWIEITYKQMNTYGIFSYFAFLKRIQCLTLPRSSSEKDVLSVKEIFSILSQWLLEWCIKKDICEIDPYILSIA